jgi:hypothetical protein
MQATKFTCPMAVVRADGTPGVGMAGGKSWTSNWLTFDNNYFQKECVAPLPGFYSIKGARRATLQGTRLVASLSTLV